jgi:hypothetical protein
MLCCFGGVCVPYTAVIPLLLLVFRWFLAKLARWGLVPEVVAKIMNLQEFQPSSNSSSSCCTTTNQETTKSCCTDQPVSDDGVVVVKELESEEEFDQLLQNGEKLVVKFTAR